MTILFIIVIVIGMVAGWLIGIDTGKTKGFHDGYNFRLNQEGAKKVGRGKSSQHQVNSLKH